MLPEISDIRRCRNCIIRCMHVMPRKRKILKMSFGYGHTIKFWIKKVVRYAAPVTPLRRESFGQILHQTQTCGGDIAQQGVTHGRDAIRSEEHTSELQSRGQ